MEDLERTSKTERRDARRRLWEVGGGTLGALGGAGMGALFGGPAGAAVGAVVGAGMGAATAWAADRGATDAADRDSQLDLDIGVHGPDLGAPNLKHPPPTVGAYSLAATGTGGSGQDVIDADGPIQPPPE
ncbi:MAG TPA: hypothetical protein VHB79_04355 [Polyangiaceae bacterium]|nr:hypothetical protein [Polyangiaceae bacterium]